jgi:hypothetical protein
MINKIPKRFIIKSLKSIQFNYLPHSDMDKVKKSLFGNDPNSLTFK